MIINNRGAIKIIVLLSGLVITGLGIFNCFNPLYLKCTDGIAATGVVTAFRPKNGWGSATINSYGKYFFKNRPCIKFLPAGSTDSIRFIAKSGGTVLSHYVINEKVTVLYNATASNYAVWNFTELTGGFVFIFLGTVLLLVVFKPGNRP